MLIFLRKLFSFHFKSFLTPMDNKHLSLEIYQNLKKTFRHSHKINGLPLHILNLPQQTPAWAREKVNLFRLQYRNWHASN